VPAVVVVLGVPTASRAQDNAEPAVLEEVVVTAQKREQSLQETPIAVTALTAGALEAASVTNVQEFGRFAPNVKLDVNRAGTQSGGPIFIRGVGQSDGLPGADPGVGVYVDGVYLGRSTGALFDLVDIERVEVLRGPQGTLYGKNTIGGAINIISQKPVNEQQGRVMVGYGNYDTLDARVMFNTPLVDDKVLLRFNGIRATRDGYTENVLTGRDVDSKDTLGGRLSLAILPSDATEILLAADGSRNRNGMIAGRRVFAGTRIAYGDPDPRKAAYNLDGKADFDNYGFSATVTHHFTDVTFKSISAYRGIDESAASDLDASPAAVVEQPLREESQWQVSQELQLSGTSLAGRLNWFTGLYYFREASDYRELSVINGGAATLDLTLDTDNKSYAVYGEGTYALTDRLSATLGARYTYETKALGIHFNAFGPARSEASWNSVTPRFVLDYKLSPNAFLYGSVSQGFKSGQLNSRARSVPELQPLDPEKVWSYEVGAKSQPLGGRARFNVALFHMEYRDIQLQSIMAATNDVGFVSSNAGKAHLDGAEIEAALRPFRGFDITASVGLIRDKYDEYVDAAGVDRSSRRFEDTPRHTYSLALQYTQPLAGGASLTFHTDYSYQGKTYYDITNAAALSQDAYSLLGARIGFTSADDRWRVAAYGKNLADKKYIVNGLNLIALLGGAGFDTFGPPRTYGLEVVRNFQ
jgi:iron complex outermembrane receptor protein